MNVVVNVLVDLVSGVDLGVLGLADGSRVLVLGVHLVELLLVLRSHVLNVLLGHLGSHDVLMLGSEGLGVSDGLDSVLWRRRRRRGRSA